MPFLFPKEGEMAILTHVSEDTLLLWEPSLMSVEIYPQYAEQKANYPFPYPAHLTCYSNALGGWKVIAEGENTAYDRTFLLVSEDQNYSIRYVLIAEGKHANSTAIKNGDALIKVDRFEPKPIRLRVYPTILGGELSQNPAGYYKGRIRACFVSN